MNRNFIRNLASMLGISRREAERYAKGTSSGWVRRAIDSLFGARQTRLHGKDRDKEVIAFLTQLGNATQPGGRRGGPPSSPPLATMPPAAGDSGGTAFKTRMPKEPPRPGEQSEFGEEVFAPQSSNVWSFSYYRRPGERLGILYVTYRAPRVNAAKGSVTHKRRRSREQLIGQRGSTIKGKSNAPGPMYAYLDVPPAIFTGMKAASSKGGFVWDRLRVRHSVFAHQYRYTLIQGGISSVAGGGAGVYIPRRATAAGFRTRSIATVGAGQRDFMTSTIPEQGGFRTRPAPGRH